MNWKILGKIKGEFQGGGIKVRLIVISKVTFRTRGYRAGESVEDIQSVGLLLTGIHGCMVK